MNKQIDRLAGCSQPLPKYISILQLGTSEVAPNCRTSADGCVAVLTVTHFVFVGQDFLTATQYSPMRGRVGRKCVFRGSFDTLPVLWQ